MPDILKHQRSGSEFPPLTEGTLRLYSMQFCPYADRTRLVLLMKNIPHEIVNINLSDKPEWFLKRVNPLGLVPAIQQGHTIVFDSLIINDYLDAVYPDVRLTPANPFEASQHRMILEMWGKVIPGFYKVFMSCCADPSATQSLLEDLDIFEERIQGKTGPFFGGERPMLIDIDIWPHAYRIPALFRCFASDVTLNPERFPVFTSWMNTMAELPVVKKTIIPDVIFKAFVTSYRNKDVNYDIGLDV